MKIWLSLILFLVSLKSFAQKESENGLAFTDSTKSALSFIAKEFYKRVQGLDTCCLIALGSAKFTVKSNRKIEGVLVSAGIPDNISKSLTEAILASSEFWQIKGKNKNAVVILPFMIGPSALCDVENHRDNIITSLTNMFSYKKENKNVKLYNYYKVATSSEEGVILSPLLIKGVTTDVYK